MTSNLEWCASVLVHESSHVERTRRSQEQHDGLLVLNEIVGTNAEIEANAAQIRVLYKLQAPYPLIVYVQLDQGQHWLSYWQAWKSNLPDPDSAIAPTPLVEVRPDLWRGLQDLIGKRAKELGCGKGD